MRLLRPARSGIFLRSFRLHSAHYARETIAKICSLGAALATAIISQTGSWAYPSRPMRHRQRPSPHLIAPAQLLRLPAPAPPRSLNN
jgi:hypothetical protein